MDLGGNSYGQLGDGTEEDKHSPVKVMDNVVAVSTGRCHTAVIKTDGSLWTWGWNSYGQLGDGTEEDKHSPVKVMDNVVAVSVGHRHTAVIKTDGSLWTWGGNNDGQLGDGTTVNRTSPEKVMDSVTSMSAGDSHMAAIKTDGTLWTWGSNSRGQLGDGMWEDERSSPVKIMENVASVSAGSAHTAAIKTDGTLWTCGWNYRGQLGTGTDADNIPSRVYVIGENKNSPVKITDNVVTVSAGEFHTIALKTDSSLWTWGDNDYGQLGDGSSYMKLAPFKVAYNIAMPNGMTPDKVISVLLNGNYIDFDQTPIILNDRVMVPIRAIFESMGYTVSWDGDARTATATQGNNQIVVLLNNYVINYKRNGVPGTYICDVMPQIISDRVLVPVRAIAESAGCTVEWDSDNKIVIINKNN